MNNADLNFRKTIMNDTGIQRAQSIVTVPMARNRCGTPQNLRVKDVDDIFSNKILLSWNPPTTGSCQITSYTVFWCHYNVNGCNADVSQLHHTKTGKITINSNRPGDTAAEK